MNDKIKTACKHVAESARMIYLTIHNRVARCRPSVLDEIVGYEMNRASRRK